jgi:UDP-N-acetyl-2-amino-2-deoxyglucuronate dehydrogenase
MTANKIRVGLIGCGAISKRRHITGLTLLKEANLDNFEVTACCDTVEDNLSEVCDYIRVHHHNGPRQYRDWQDMVCNAPVDAVVVSLPHGLHHLVGISCLNAGLHVLMEKPFTVTMKTGRALVDAARQAGRILALAVPFRRSPNQRAVRWALNEGKLIGTPRLFFANRTQLSPPRRAASRPVHETWRQDRLMGGGVFVIDSGFHFQDSVRYFFGEPEQVYAEVRAYRDDGPPIVRHGLASQGENTLFVTYSFKNGVIGTFCWSGAAAGKQTHQCTIHGSAGFVEDVGYADPLSIFHLYSNGVELSRRDGSLLTEPDLQAMHRQAIGPDQVQRLFPNGVIDHYAIEFWDFFDSIEHLRRPEVDGDDGLRTLALVEAIYESAWSGGAVKIDEMLSGAAPYGWQAEIDAYWDQYVPPRLVRLSPRSSQTDG